MIKLIVTVMTVTSLILMLNFVSTRSSLHCDPYSLVPRMTKSEVRALCGDPDHEGGTNYPIMSGEVRRYRKDQWAYGRSTYLYFDSDLLDTVKVVR